MHKENGKVGYADLPAWINFDEKPPRSFDIFWESQNSLFQTNTNIVVPITKEVYDIMRSV
jgi:hypothetical protein